MAGSYNHVVTDDGNLRSPEMVNRMLENGGDVYEAIEEMYGMIWWLASLVPDAGPMASEDLVEMARTQYAVGLKVAESNLNKRKTQ